MSFFDKIKDIMSATDEEDDYDENPVTEKFESTDRADRNDYYTSSKPVEKTTPFPDRKSGRTMGTAAASQLQVALVKPERFEDAPAIADHLADHRTVVLNLEAADRDTQRRMLDFLSGAAYAHDGRIKRVANNTFIITPCNVDVMGELLLDEMENNRSYL